MAYWSGVCKGLSQPCADTKAIAQVGAISANADENIGGIVKVCAATEVEMKEKKTRVEDALPVGTRNDRYVKR